jgi:site-specific DNA recombinase
MDGVREMRKGDVVTIGMIYARTSTERQEREETIKSQVESCEAYCASNGLKIQRSFIDDGVSGSILQRPALAELRERVRRKETGVVVVYDIDRLSRNLGHLLLLMEEFARAEVDVRFVRSPLEDSPEGRVMFNIKGVFAEYEREKIRERTLRGKVRYIKEGGWFGKPPYGYRLVKQHLEVDEAEADWLKQMFSLYASARSTLHGLADHLNANGVPTRGTNNRRPGWQASIISRILARELYTGTFRREIRGIPESACEVDVPGLVDRATWERVQARLRINQADAERNRIHFYLLSGLVRCGACGHRYHGSHPKRAGVSYYRCETNQNPARYETASCRNGGVRADALEAAVWRQVVELVTQPEAILLGQRMLAEEAAADGGAAVEERLFQVRRGLTKVNARKSRLLDVLIDRPQDQHILTGKLDELDREAEQLRDREHGLVEEMKNASTRQERLSQVRDAFKTLRPRLAKLNAADRREVCQLLIQVIRVGRGRQVQVEWVIPTSNGEDERSTSSFVLTRKRMSPEARAQLAARNRVAMRRRVAAGLYVSPTKDPAIAKKVSEALTRRVREGTWKRPPAPLKDPLSGRWVKGPILGRTPAMPKSGRSSAAVSDLSVGLTS